MADENADHDRDQDLDVEHRVPGLAVRIILDGMTSVAIDGVLPFPRLA